MTALPQTRLEALDGLRGFAAVVVFLHHALMLFYPSLGGLVSHSSPWEHREVLFIMARWPVGWLFNGPFAVSFFFVLSGFVLTLQVRQSSRPVFITELLLRRFLRLAPLVVVASVLGYAMFRYETEGLQVLGQLNGALLKDYFAPELIARHGFAPLLWQVFFSVWYGGSAPYLFDPVLWSIGAEFHGSALVYVFLCLFDKPIVKLTQAAVCFVLGALLLGPNGTCFVVGMLFGDRYLRRGKVLALSKWVLLALSCGALVYASINPFNATLWLALPTDLPSGLNIAAQAVAAVVLIAAALQVPWLSRACASGAGKFLGLVSYGLYVIHMPILYGLGAPGAVFLHRHIGYDAAAVLASGCILLICLALGYVLIRWVDVPLNRQCRRFVGRRIIGPPKAFLPRVSP